MTTTRAVAAHLARLGLAVLVAVAGWLAFPGHPGDVPRRLDVGAVAPADVIAPRGFVVPKTAAERAMEAEALAATVKAVVKVDPGAADTALALAARAFAALDSAAAAGAALAPVARDAGLVLDSAGAATLERGGARARLRRAVLVALRASRSGYLAPGVSPADLGRDVVLRSGADERTAPAESLPTFGDFLERAAQGQPAAADPGAEALFVRVLGAFFQPTLVYERAETEQRRNALRRSVDTVATVVRAGEKIIGAHEVVTPDATRKLGALRQVLRRAALGPGGGAVAALGEVGLGTLVLAVFGVFCAYHRRPLYRSLRAMGAFAVGFGVTLVAAGLVARLAPGRPELIPVAFAVMLFTMLFDSRVALLAAAVVAALVALQTGFAGSHAAAIVFVAGAAAALSLERIRRRSDLYRSLAVVTAVYAGAAVLVGLSGGDPVAAVGRAALFGAANAVFSAMLAMLVLPLAEGFTHCTTDLTLLELSDPSRPLLRRLATEAPGTYAHSIAMANLCESACNAIGANGLLARVGCYYHDIGKLVRPLYFVENLGRGKNPHDHLKPSQSAAVIRRHVEDGLRLAEEHRLPEVVRAFIPEHHGTAPIAYFVERARESEPQALEREELFRYPGPGPASAETAVALLADSVEAALRVLDEPTSDTVHAAIEHLVQARLESGQLRGAPLTLAQIETVKQEFVRALAGMYHDRLDYPEDAGGITADWEIERHA